MPTSISEFNGKWRYFEGTTSAASVLADLAKIMCLGVRTAKGDIIIERNWDIVYPVVNTSASNYIPPLDKHNLSPTEFRNKIENQLVRVTNKVILKTTINSQSMEMIDIDDLSVEDDLNAAQATMYIELYKPEYLADPERFHPETERIGVLPTVKVYNEQNFDPESNIAAEFSNRLLINNHYILVRAFDSVVYSYDQYGRISDVMPREEIKDDFTGTVVETKSHISEWAKLAWYQDFQEINIDEYDASPGTLDHTKGVEFIPINTPGLNSETRFNFYMNTNNNRAIIFLAGNPSLEFTKNGISKHLISMAYMGRIESFAGSINDVIGNFALTASSSTAPCKVVEEVKSRMVTIPGEDLSYVDNRIQGINQAIAVADGAKTRFTMNLLFAYEPGSMEVIFDHPDDGISTVNRQLYVITRNILEFTAPPKRGTIIRVRARFIIPELKMVPGVTRDEFGNVINIIRPDKYGKNTATCISDIGMWTTRSKAYWQAHKVMFNTTEEFMTKEQYGKSAYTNEYYADKIKITHANDGPRGMLEGCIVIDQSSLYPLDELVVNRDFVKRPEECQEVYIYFPITANYSFLASGPNVLSGVALLKDALFPDPKDNDEAARRVVDDLYIGRIGSIISNFELPMTGLYGAKISWEAEQEDHEHGFAPWDGAGTEPTQTEKESERDGRALIQHIEIGTGADIGWAIVTRPEEFEENVQVTLTATVIIDEGTPDEVDLTRVFYCTVVKMGLSDEQAVAADRKWLSLIAANKTMIDTDSQVMVETDAITGLESINNIKVNLILPSRGPNETSISWLVTETDETTPSDAIEIVNS